MADQIVITEKTSQAKDVRAAVGSRYGDILPAEGHLLDLLEPEDVVPTWKRWSPILLRPDGLYGTRPAEGGNKAAKLKAIRDALRDAQRVWLATDCDREGQLIGQEILEHYQYRGQVMRVLFTAQDPQTIRDAFGRAKPNANYASLYAAAVARRQADQIYNLAPGPQVPRRCCLPRRLRRTKASLFPTQPGRVRLPCRHGSTRLRARSAAKVVAVLPGRRRVQSLLLHRQRQKGGLGSPRHVALPQVHHHRRLGRIREPIPHCGFPMVTRMTP